MLDVLIQNGMVLDGTGRAGFAADVAVENGKIMGIGHFPDAAARMRVDAAGKVVTPGFLDIHRHADAAVFRPGFGRAELRQGLTTIINGNCGLSAAPCGALHSEEILRYLAPVTGALAKADCARSMETYLQTLDKTPLPLHVGMLVGGGTLRACVAGFAAGSLDKEQLRALHGQLEQSLEAGALGVSLGLGYAPECFYTTQELVEALRPLEGTNVPVTVHMRQEGDGVTQTLREMLTVARTLRISLEISHLKAIGKQNWNARIPEMLRLLDEARAEGQDVACDAYPYTRGSTQLIHVLPPECQNGGVTQLTKALRDPAYRAQLRQRMEQDSDFENISLLCGWENVYVTSVTRPENARFVGKSVAQAAREMDKDPFDLVFDLLADENCTPSMIDEIAGTEDLERVLKTPYCSMISDSTYPDTGLLHPRVYGSVARLFEIYVNQKHLLTMEDAVRKVTSLPASRLRLEGKGMLRVGSDADLNVFAPQNIHECGTYTNPAQEAVGMDYVFVAGHAAIAAGKFTKECAGSVLRR